MFVLQVTFKSVELKRSQPTTFDHIDIKFIWGPHVDNKVYTLNKYHFQMLIYYKETIIGLRKNS